MLEEIVGLVREPVAAVEIHSSKGRFIGVVCPGARRQSLAAALGERGIEWHDADKGSLGGSINLVSPVAAKGLEFDAVVVFDPQAIVDAGPAGHRML